VNLATVAAALAALILGGFLILIWLKTGGDGYEPDCAEYSFKRDAWREVRGDQREHEAEALAECDALVGKTRAEVTRMLGEHDTRGSTSTSRKWWFFAGEVNDAFGPGDGQTLYVHFDHRGVVKRATLAYPD